MKLLLSTGARSEAPRGRAPGVLLINFRSALVVNGHLVCDSSSSALVGTRSETAYSEISHTKCDYGFARIMNFTSTPSLKTILSDNVKIR